MRILITGSREWKDPSIIFEAIQQVIDENPGEEYIIVHGDCPTGADSMADFYAKHMTGCRPERHPANWETFKKAAGPLRNTEMVEAGADICLAFLHKDSRGTVDCKEKARAAGIPVREFTEGL